MHSMTGYGRAAAARAGHELIVELRSVNHRYLDLSFRLPRPLQPLEPMLRKQLSERLSRGHVDLSFSLESEASAGSAVKADVGLVRAYAKAAREVAEAAGIRAELDLATLLSLPDVLIHAEAKQDEEALASLAQEALGLAIDRLLESRAAEGEALRADLSGYLDQLARLTREMTKLAPLQAEGFQSRLRERLKGLEVDGLEPQRLAQEVAIFADRVAVDEELARLEAHIEQMRQILRQGGAMGRKLDFLAQEMGREVNTTASKASLIELTRLCLEGKNCVEKIREQVQNLE